MQEYDVAVVGYGPTGMVAASLLGRHGHRVVVLERWPTLYGLPRFTHVDGEVARVLQGAADVDRALRGSGPTQLTFRNAEGQQLIHIPSLTGGTSGFADHISIHQPDIEDALDERIRSLATVQVRQGCAVTGLDQDDDGVWLDVGRWNGATRTVEGEPEHVRARYVIAADGAGSSIRDLLAVGQDDLGFNERWMNLDVEWLGEPPSQFEDTVQTCDPARGHMTMRIGRSRQRFEFALLPGEETAEIDRPEVGWSLLGSTYDVGPDDVRVLRHLVYTFEARIARRWQVGRVFLAGDAAHTMPPYLGQGACSGIRDAANLAWKLDLVLGGHADETVLACYEPERRAHVTALVHASVALGRVANTHDVDQAAARDAAFLAGKVPPPPPFPSMAAGVLRSGPDGVVPPVGTLTPQPRVRVGEVEGRFDDLVGPGFRLVVRVGEVSQESCRRLADLGGQVVRIGVDVVDVEGVLGSYLDGLDADAYLARPDFVLFGTASADAVDALVEDLAAALARPVVGSPA